MYIKVRETSTEYEVADVFREYGEAYRAEHIITPEQARVMGSIVACRTAQLGGHVQECLACGAVQIAYNSCRDRHCPKCEKFKRAQWVENQKVMLLPIPYFHVVFTTDHAINELVPDNQRAIYNLLFHTATDVLQVYAGQELGCTLGITVVLHTWSQRLYPHVHIHCIVTGGGLSLDGEQWCASKPDYLFDIVAVSATYRDRFCAGLQKLYDDGKLETEADVSTIVSEIQAKSWEVFAKPFKDPETVYEYLSRYVNQVAISNYRITDISDGQVSFSYHDNLDEGQEKELRLPADEFIRRFLWHVLPSGFVRIRYYGLHHASARAKKLPTCRKLLGESSVLPEPEQLSVVLWLQDTVGVDVHVCHWCGAYGMWQRRGEVNDVPLIWLMLKAIIGVLMPQPVVEEVV